MRPCVQYPSALVVGLLTGPLTPSASDLWRFAGRLCAGFEFAAGESLVAVTGAVGGEVSVDRVPPGKVRSAAVADRMRSEVQ
jgi:hypothetical protein